MHWCSCRIKNFKLILVLLFLNWTVGSVHGQLQDQIERESIEKAESLATDLVALSSDLPARWAARQRRETRNTFDLANLKYSEIRLEEVWASDQMGKEVYTRCSLGERIQVVDSSDEGGPFDRDILTRTSGRRLMCKVGREAWTPSTVLPQAEIKSTFPTNWSVGLLNSAKIGSMKDTEYLQQSLWGLNRGCFAALRDKEGSLVSFWGIEGKTDPPIAMQIIFSAKEGLPISYGLLKFPTSTSKESIAKRDFTKLEEGKVQWKKFPQVQRNGKPILLPVRVEILSVLNPGEELECVNEIVWKFGKEVPDSLFVDPTKSEIVEPDFDK